ncbi:hypothetical protein PCIT_a4415 [Pseudoalteromonas citrea]|uniref:Glycosyl transferase n=2 Tax=Pseudoalteromonas citrea TaxID=43655 RepID=A0AAD4AFW7_9GAMM|nr:glycosyltransferase [Pseudoalteromonas citrea]KAF7767514.1 hypothetical protein PCIT_a4415 [Pseudoalteromonas citrea]
MRKAIFTLAIGDNPMYQAAIASFQHYANKVGADLIVSNQITYQVKIDNPKFHASPAWAEKLSIGSLLQTYERVLYLDADVLIHPLAENIFDIYTDLEVVYMLNEGRNCHRSDERKSVEDYLGKANWPTIEGKPVYYNAGVILISKACELFSHIHIGDLQKLCNKIRFYEQTCFNYTLHKYDIKHEELSIRFNRMDMFGQEGYLDADFIHYAGKGYARNSRRRDVQFLKDFAALYQNILPKDHMDALKAQAWHDYLAVVCKKYPLPNWLIKQCSNWFVPH